MVKNEEDTNDDELQVTEGGADNAEPSETQPVVIHRRKAHKPLSDDDVAEASETAASDEAAAEVQQSSETPDAKAGKTPGKAPRKGSKAQGKASEDLDSDERGALATFRELTSDRSEFRQNLSLRHILGGDILTIGLLRHQIWLILLIFVLTVLYVSNRYAAQQEMLELTNLQEQLTDLKYDALSRSSELTEKSRLSHIEDFLVQMNDSLVQGTPYIISVDK
jgi:hypothetical protein